MTLHILIFITSFFLLVLSSKWLIDALIKLAKFLGWKEFVVAFFTMAMAGAIPNLSVGLSSVFHKVPQLSFAEIVGGNIVDLTVAVALAALISKKGLTLASRTVQGSAIFTLIVAVLPLLLIADGQLSQIDGLLLVSAFFVYIFWLFNKEDRFSKIYNKIKRPLGFKTVFQNIGILIGAIILLVLAAEGIVRSATFFSMSLNLPLVLIGILIVGLGNALPEIFFSIQAAKRGKDWLVVGNVMGSIIIPATLVLGIVAFFSPIKITDFSPFAIGRFFLIVSAIFFLLFIRTNRKITKKEAVFLLLIYLAFVLAEIMLK
ncbi:MAG: sodium:calcium antiporter [Parcubacteria group bacterium]|nr:sodium:calcium antiporter [Parcubacteria group bacterium]